MMTNRFAFFECRPRVRLKEVLILSLLLCASALTVPANAQQPTIITFDVPGAGTAPGQGTFGIAVNPEGAIAGYYFDVNYAVHGFVRGSNGAITEFDAAGAGTAGGQGTAPLSYNPAGAITGFSIDVNYAHHGFLRAPDGAVTTFDVLGAGTGAGQGTEARNINPEGAIAGRYYDASDVVHGFVRAPNGAITTFDVAGAGTGFHQGTESCGLDCITPEGVIAGNYYDASGVQHGMVRANDGTVTTFDVPGAGTGAGQGTHTAGINPAGEIEGHYVDARGVSHGFLRTSDGAITTFDASGAGTASGQGTTPSNINPDGATPGSYIDANNVLHGFVRDQEGEITKFDVPGAGTAAFQGTFPISNNPANSITGWYTDASGVSHGFLRRGSKTIAQIQITGEPVIVFDHRTDQQQPLNIPDDQITAWREADGTVNLLIPHYEAYRMRGPNLLHLTIDPNEIYSSTQSGSQIPENLYNYHHWLSGPYSLDGRTFYSLAHSEWYACLLNGDCDQIGANGLSATLNSWANTINSFVSADGGASWHLNAVNNNHVVAQTAFYWTGSVALADKIYLEALNHSGMFQPTRVIKEGSFYYAIGYYIHRDFSRIDPAHGVYQAPIDKTGYALIRTNDITNPNGWQAWTGGGSYQSFPTQNIAVFLPQQNGSTLNAAPPQLVFDTNVQCYILIHTLYGGSNAVNYMTTRSLANPSWSQSTPILGTAQLITDPGGPVQGFNDANYPSILDNSSSGFNFEFTRGHPLLFWSTFPAQYGGNNLGRDLYRAKLSVTYDEEEEQTNQNNGCSTPPPPTVYIDTPPQGSTVSGTVTVSGWAIDNSSGVGTAISSVQVKVDGTAVGAATYGESRPDVCAVYPGRPGCPDVGYSFSLNTFSLSSGTHTITVTATDSDETPDMGSTSVTVTVQPTPPTVYIDTPPQGSTVSGTVTVSGWAIDNSSGVGTAISNVQVKVDGTVVGTATYGNSRPDVCAVYPGRPGCPNVGYSFSLNTSSLGSGTHTITATATDSDATPDTGSASVSVTK